MRSPDWAIEVPALTTSAVTSCLNRSVMTASFSRRQTLVHPGAWPSPGPVSGPIAYHAAHTGDGMGSLIIVSNRVPLSVGTEADKIHLELSRGAPGPRWHLAWPVTLAQRRRPPLRRTTCRRSDSL